MFNIATAMPTGKDNSGGGSSGESTPSTTAASPRSPSEGGEVGRIGGQTHVVTDHEGKPQATTVFQDDMEEVGTSGMASYSNVIEVVHAGAAQELAAIEQDNKGNWNQSIGIYRGTAALLKKKFIKK